MFSRRVLVPRNLWARVMMCCCGISIATPLEQSFALHTMVHALGARILLRSALETLSAGAGFAAQSVAVRGTAGYGVHFWAGR
jgi:hypothetical protein